MVTETAENLCKSMGQVIHSNDRSEMKCGDFMLVRVEIDVHKPLCRGRRVRFSSDREGWVSFLYERLPIFCHWYGVLNHDFKKCNLWLQNKGELRTENQEYGSWLRADPPSLLRKKW
uniref:Zinc knuckle CX2CX4HX4C domain-containing protein n=1 Tax=Quercus lobata TaxID=97700 RepID=A0A7N2N306_QUELO